MHRVVIVCEGGVVQEVFGDADVQYLLVDFDEIAEDLSNFPTEADAVQPLRDMDFNIMRKAEAAFSKWFNDKIKGEQ